MDNKPFSSSSSSSSQPPPPHGSTARPATLWVPPRGNFPESWLAVRHVVSVYYLGHSAFIELPQTTVELVYGTHEEAHAAAKCFVDAMASEPTAEMKAQYPVPVRGGLRVIRWEYPSTQ